MPIGSDPRDPLVQKIQQAHNLISGVSATGVLAYLNQLTIEAGGRPEKLRSCFDPWQWQIAQLLAPAIEHAAGLLDSYSGPRFFYLVMTKGHNKSSFIAWLCDWLLAYHKRPSLSGLVASGDKEQAALLIEFMKKTADLNPWLEKRLFFKSNEVRGNTTRAKLEVLAADASTAHGKTPDFIILDEITWWPDKENSEKLFAALNGAREKKKHCILIILSNAGILGTWQHNHLLKAKKSSAWRVYESPEGQVLASWMKPEKIEELKSELPPMMAERMWSNKWLDPAESGGLFRRHEVEACAELGRQMGLVEKRRGTPGTLYCLSLDYGPIKDRTVGCIMHQEGELVIIDQMKIWQGSRKARVSIEEVEQWINDCRANFDLAYLVADPHGLESTLQKLESQMQVIRFESRGGKGNHAIYTALRSSIINKRLTWHEGCGDLFPLPSRQRHSLVDEMTELIVKQMAYGLRVDHLTNKHDDRTISASMGLVQILKQPLRRSLYLTEHWF